MKKRYQSIIIVASLICTGCGDFLSEYSQDMIVAKKVSDLDEVLLGSVYLPSNERKYGPANNAGGVFNILDDDINTSRVKVLNTNVNYDTYAYSIFPLFGYHAWQLEVGRNYNGTEGSNDAVTWNDLYNRINIANMILEEIVNLPHEQDQDAKDYLRVQGEALFLRAHFYFTLANLYGDAYSPKDCATKLAVPLKLTHYVEHDKTKPTQFNRATVKEVYDQIVKDLLAAEDFLIQANSTNIRLHRASVEAVELFLSRVYLYSQDWENAEKKANAVISSGNFSLSVLSTLAPQTTFLTTDNTEVIFSQGSNHLASPNVLTGGGGDYCVTMDLYNQYDVTKDRRVNTFFTLNPESDSIGLTNKYIRGANLKAHISDAFLLRKAEAYLNKAEACAMQTGKEGEANEMLNEIRRNRIDDYIAQNYTGKELVKQIRNERRKELCFEGHRWFDLRRYAVCEKYPYSRNIVHVMNVHDMKEMAMFLTSLSYALPAGDPAYTFQIPKDVLNFDVVPMPSNPREVRPALASEGKTLDKDK